MSIKLKAQLEGMKLNKFSFLSFTKEISSQKEDEKERNYYLKFQLDGPIPKVVRSISEYNPETNERAHREITDVMEVCCNLNDILKYETEFVFDEDADGNLTLSGKYAGDMFLDLAASGTVWLSPIKFSTFKAEKRRETRIQSWSKLFPEQPGE